MHGEILRHRFGWSNALIDEQAGLAYFCQGLFPSRSECIYDLMCRAPCAIDIYDRVDPIRP